MGFDPAGVDEDNPHSFNRYAYGNNNPYKYLDPDGRASEYVDCNGCRHTETSQRTTSTDVSGYAKASAIVGQQFSNQGAAEVHCNRLLSAVTGNPAAGGHRPDVAPAWKNGSVSRAESVSSSQTPESQSSRGAAMQSKLTAIGRGGNANTLTIPQASSAAALVKGIGGLGLISCFIRAYEIGKMETGRPIRPELQAFYITGTLTREQGIDASRIPLN